MKIMYYPCRNCGEISTMPARRGRPPQLCQKCLGVTPQTEDVEAVVASNTRLIEENEKKRLAEERVDRLERQLKLFGRHISQHRHNWE